MWKKKKKGIGMETYHFWLFSHPTFLLTLRFFREINIIAFTLSNGKRELLLKNLENLLHVKVFFRKLYNFIVVGFVMFL